jgi:hypothetical protein
MNRNCRRHPLKCFWLVIVCAVCCAPRAESQEIGDPQKIQVESALVTVPVVVRDVRADF